MALPAGFIAIAGAGSFAARVGVLSAGPRVKYGAKTAMMGMGPVGKKAIGLDWQGVGFTPGAKLAAGYAAHQAGSQAKKAHNNRNRER